MIVTQTPPPDKKKHDRTGNFVPRAKLTGEFVKMINDGLYYYEQVFSLKKTKLRVTVHLNSLSLEFQRDICSP